jgi:hypothetical protein
MIRTTARFSRKPKAERSAQARATLVFRDFVRQFPAANRRNTESSR